MRQKASPTITAPISRTKRRKRHAASVILSSPLGIVCAVFSAIFAFGGTLLLAMAVISSSSSSSSNNDANDANANDDANRDFEDAIAGNNGNIIANVEQQQIQGAFLRMSKEAALRSSTTNNNNIRAGAAAVVPQNNPSGVSSSSAENTPKGLIIHTHKNMGDIRIHFTPELSGESSIRYIVNLVKSASENGGRITNTEGFTCQRCKFYRAEKKLLLQGVISDGSRPNPSNDKVALGPCPDANYVPKLKCPSHDPNCGCHGPIMTKGMVGWAGGGAGPDFFINTFEKPVDWWEKQHTVWGQIRDPSSLAVVERMYELPAHMSGMRMLDSEIEFSLELF